MPPILQQVVRLQLPLLLLLGILLLVRVQAHDTIDSSQEYNISDDINFDYMLQLSSNDNNHEEQPIITFYWKSPNVEEISKTNNDNNNNNNNSNSNSNSNSNNQKKIVKCRIIHDAKSISQQASWLGVGIQDIKKMSTSSTRTTTVMTPSTTKNLMIGADAIIGFSDLGHVMDYKLGNTYEGDGGVKALYGYNDDLFVESESKMTQTFNLWDDSVTTIFDFALFVDSNYDRHGNVKDDTKNIVRGNGNNLFIFAVGPPIVPDQNTNSIGKHVEAGSFIIDFDNVGTEKERSYILTNTQTDCIPQDDNYKEKYDFVITLPGKVKFYWRLDKENDVLDIQFSYLGNAWLGLGISKDEDGKMIGADAIIGRPALMDANPDEKPLKYHLSKKEQGGVYPMNSMRQTLTDSYLMQDDVETIMRFTKPLVETITTDTVTTIDDDQNIISKTNSTTFIYAIGRGNVLSKHVFANSFSIDLNECPIINETNIDNDGLNMNDKRRLRRLWIIHGVFGTLAFAVFVPVSISGAILRELLPTTWIFVHVYGNLVALLFTLIAVFIAISTTSQSGHEHFTESHHKIGLALFSLSLFQALNGLFRPFKVQETQSIDKKKRDLWRIFHRVVGLTILGLGLFQVGDGLSMFSKDYGGLNLVPVYLVLLIIIGWIVIGTKLWLFVFGNAEKRVFLGNDLHLEAEHLELGPQHRETELT